jgi:hypothetical protein
LKCGFQASILSLLLLRISRILEHSDKEERQEISIGYYLILLYHFFTLIYFDFLKKERVKNWIGKRRASNFLNLAE